MPTCFTSDHHFGHAGALGLYERPFASVAEMDRQMIDRWNSVIGPDDEVRHLSVRHSPTARPRRSSRQSPHMGSFGSRGKAHWRMNETPLGTSVAKV